MPRTTSCGGTRPAPFRPDAPKVSGTTLNRQRPADIPKSWKKPTAPNNRVQTGANAWHGNALRDGGDLDIGTMTLTAESETEITLRSLIALADMLNPSGNPGRTAMFPPDCAALLTFTLAHGAS